MTETFSILFLKTLCFSSSSEPYLLLVCVLEWDPWGVPDDYECEVVENDAPVPKHVPLHRPGPLPKEFYNTMEAIGNKKDDSAAVAAAAAAATGPPSTS